MDAQKFGSIICQTHIFLKFNGPSFRSWNEGLSSSGVLGGISMIAEGLYTSATGLIKQLSRYWDPHFMTSSNLALEE